MWILYPLEKPSDRGIMCSVYVYKKFKGLKLSKRLYMIGTDKNSKKKM